MNLVHADDLSLHQIDDIEAAERGHDKCFLGFRVNCDICERVFASMFAEEYGVPLSHCVLVKCCPRFPEADALLPDAYKSEQVVR